jgi:hypothetical protein
MQSRALLNRRLVLESLPLRSGRLEHMDQPAPIFSRCHDVHEKFWRLADFRRINGDEKTTRNSECVPVGYRRTEKVTGEI